MLAQVEKPLLAITSESPDSEAAYNPLVTMDDKGGTHYVWYVRNKSEMAKAP
jgi:hypothetical protein